VAGKFIVIVKEVEGDSLLVQTEIKLIFSPMFTLRRVNILLACS